MGVFSAVPVFLEYGTSDAQGDNGGPGHLPTEGEYSVEPVFRFVPVG